MAKLFGYNYTIAYKPGIENKVADALSRQYIYDSQFCGLTMPVFNVIDQIKAEYISNAQLQDKIKQVLNNGGV